MLASTRGLIHFLPGAAPCVRPAQLEPARTAGDSQSSVLDITAIPGPGNLLGNLLCDVANLLNGGGALSQIVTALNNLLALL